MVAGDLVAAVIVEDGKKSMGGKGRGRKQRRGSKQAFVGGSQTAQAIACR